MTPTRRLALGLFALTALVGGPLGAQKPAAVSGRVRSDNGPVSGAQVTLVDLQRRTETDAAGTFRFADVPAGRYVLAVSAPGYAPYEASVTVAGGASITISLSPSAVALPTILVTAQPTPSASLATPFASSTLEGDALRRNQNVSLARAIEQLPGVRSLTTGAQIGKPVIRGLTGDRVLVLDDGQRLADYSWSDEDGPSLDARLADRVEVIRGPMSLRYGSEALGGVVNALSAPLPEATSDGGMHRWWAELSGASNNAESGTLLSLEGASGRVGYRATGIFRRAASLHTPDGELDNTGFVSTNGAAEFGIRGDHGSATIRIEHNGGEFKLLESNGPPAGAAEGQDAGPERKSRDERVQLEWLRTLGGWRAELAGQFQQHSLIEVSDEASPGGEPGQESTAFDLLLNTLSGGVTLYHPGSVLHTTVGVSGLTQHNDSRGPIPLVPDATTSNGAAFGIVEARREHWSVLAGLRGDMTRINADANPDLAFSGGTRNFKAATGNLGIVFRPVEGIALTASAGRAWRAPNLFELFTAGPKLSEARYEVGDPALKTEAGTSLDASLRWQRSRVRGEVAAYRHQIDHYTYIQPGGYYIDGLPVYNYVQSNARLTGFEAALSVDPTAALTLRGRLDGVRGTNRETDQPLPLTPPLRSTVGAELHGSGFSWARRAHVGVDVVTVARQNRLAPIDEPTDGYTLVEVDAGLERTLGGREFRLDLAVHNAGNVKYRDFLSRYKLFALNPGRDILLRLAMGF